MDRVSLKDRKLLLDVSEGLIGTKLAKGVEHPRTHEMIVNAGRKITPALLREIEKAHLTQVEV